jgi:PAS domain S-box-containing protein
MTLFLLVAVFTGYSIYSFLRASDSVRAAANRDSQLDNTEAALKDIQRGVRGYLITGDASFLAPCDKGRRNAARAIDSLRESLRAFPSKQKEFEGAVALADTLLVELTREVGYAERGDVDRAMEIVKTGEAKRAMDSISTVFARLAGDETTLANSENLRAQENLTRALTLLAVGGGCNFLVLIAIFAAVQLQLRERIRLSQTLATNEARLQLIIQSMQEGLTVSAVDGTLELFNPRMQEITGYSMDEANASTSFRARLHPETGCLQETAGFSAFETEIETRHGEERTLRGCVRDLEQAGPRMRLTTYQDVTEEKRAQEALRIQKAYFERLFASLPEGIALIDEKGKLHDVNGAYEEIFGFTRDEVLDRDFTTLTVPNGKEEEARGRLQRVINGEIVEFETQRQKKDGTMIDVAIIATSVDLGIGKRMSYGIYRDITERKQTEKERERLITELQQALSDVKTLSGLLPICAWCKKVRDDKGYYHQIEAYLTHHSGAKFTHGICPDCAGKFTDDLKVRSQ